MSDCPNFTELHPDWQECMNRLTHHLVTLADGYVMKKDDGATFLVGLPRPHDKYILTGIGKSIFEITYDLVGKLNTPLDDLCMVPKDVNPIDWLEGKDVPNHS